MHLTFKVRPPFFPPWLLPVSQEGRVSFSGVGEGRCLEAVAVEEGATLLPGLCREGEAMQRWHYRWAEGGGGSFTCLVWWVHTPIICWIYIIPIREDIFKKKIMSYNVLLVCAYPWPTHMSKVYDTLSDPGYMKFQHNFILCPLEKYYTLEGTSNSFPGTTSMSGRLENSEKCISKFCCSPIQVTRS